MARAYVIMFQGSSGHIVSWGVFPAFPARSRLGQRLLFDQLAQDYTSAEQLAYSKTTIDLRYAFLRDVRCRTKPSGQEEGVR